MANLKEELQKLTKNYKSTYIEDITEKLRGAASEGKTFVYVYSGYDSDTIAWLRDQGLDVIQVSTQRDSFIKITWGTKL
jgi:hypothetical protein